MTHSLIESQAKRLQKVISDLEITPYKFSKDLGYKSPDTIYHIINGHNGPSNNLLKRIEESEYPINIEWILTGYGDSINNSIELGMYGSEINSNSKIIYPSELDFHFLKQIAQDFAKVIGIEDDSYSLKTRICARKGLEFFFQTFIIDNISTIRDKEFSIVMQPDWKVSTYFDFWRVNCTSIRGQNLLELYRGISQKFENVIFKYHEELKYLMMDTNNEYEMQKYLKDEDKFIEIYTTDSRI